MPIIETESWMRPITDVDGKEYLLLGRILRMNNTLAVTPRHGNGGTLYFCKTHRRAYKHGDACPKCRDAVVEQPSEADVTARNMP